MKVTPKNDDIRRLIKHPTAGAFPASGPAEWPDDSFTARRIADGDVTVATEAPAEGALPPAQPATPVPPPPAQPETAAEQPPTEEEAHQGRGKRK